MGEREKQSIAYLYTNIAQFPLRAIEFYDLPALCVSFDVAVGKHRSDRVLTLTRALVKPYQTGL